MSEVENVKLDKPLQLEPYALKIRKLDGSRCHDKLLVNFFARSLQHRMKRLRIIWARRLLDSVALKGTVESEATARQEP